MELYLLVFSLIVFVVYNSLFILNYGIPESISATYYKLKGRKQVIFTLALWGFSIPVAIAAETGLLFFAGAFISFVGASPSFKNKGLERKVHFIGAYTGTILGFLSLFIDYNLLVVPLIGIFIISNLFGRVKNYIFWVEVVAYLIIYSGLFYSYI